MSPASAAIPSISKSDMCHSEQKWQTTGSRGRGPPESLGSGKKTPTHEHTGSLVNASTAL